MGKPEQKPGLIRTRVKDPARIKATHRRIAEAAALLFSKNGFHKTSMREISQASGIELSYLYKYIASKDDILLLFYELLFDRYFALFEATKEDGQADPAQRMVTMIHMFIETSRGYYRQTMAAYTETRHLRDTYFAAVKSKELQYSKAFQEIIEQGNAQGCFDVEDPLLVSNFLQHLMMADIARRWAYGKERSIEETRDQLVKFIMKALGYKGDPNELGQPVGTFTNKETKHETDQEIS